MKNIISSNLSSSLKSLSTKLKAFVLPAIALAALALVLNANHSPSKAELRFAETSPAGSSAGAVLPASCESGYAHFAGECTTASVSPVYVAPPAGCSGWGCNTYCGLTHVYWGAACHGVTGNYSWGVWYIVNNDTAGYSGAQTASCNGFGQIQKDSPADFPGYSDPSLINPYCNKLRYDPIGWFDSVNASHVASGWSVDPDTPAAAVTIHFYVYDPNAGTFVMAGQTPADTYRPDVLTAGYGTGAYHGFLWEIPNGYCSGTLKYLYAYAIDTAALSSPLLAGSPKAFNCVAVGPTITVTRNPWSNIPEGTNGLVTWATTNATSLNLTCSGPYTTNRSMTPLTGDENWEYGSILAGTTTCNWVATGAGGTASYPETFTVSAGSLTLSSSTCIISTGQSTCTVNATWTTVNSPDPSLKDGNTGATLSSLANGTALPVYVTGGAGTIFNLYSGTGLIAAKLATGVCAAGSAWTGSSCVAPTVQINSAVVDNSNNLTVNHTCTNSASYEIWLTKPTPSVMVTLHLQCTL
jgi:hypothetical protein